MPEGELSFGDESELASKIRDFIGVGPYEKVEVVTPQFDRDDGIKVTVRPQSTEQLDKIKKLPDDVLRRIGVGPWSHGEMPGKEWKQWLFPCEWYDCIPEGYEIHTILGEVKTFQRGETSKDRRFGCLCYGWVVGDMEAWRESESIEPIDWDSIPTIRI